MRKELIQSHSQRLHLHYKKKGLSEEQVSEFVSYKLQKLENNREDHFEDYSRYFKSKVFDDLFEGLSEGQKVVDIGCGSGELIAALMESRPNHKFVGVEPYKEEREIGLELIKGLSKDGVIYSSLDECLAIENVGLALFFSVTEHLDDETFNEILASLNRASVRYLYILVPNKYKVRDDHTGLPFIGLLPHKVAGAVSKLLGSSYLLSDGSVWDVWYRSAYTYEEIISIAGYKSEFLQGDDVFPRLDICPLVKTSAGSFTGLSDIKFIFNCIVRFFSRKHSADNFPYLNIVARSIDA